MSDLSKVPLSALSSETKYLISTLLNPPKVIPTNNGRLRDWRGIAQICSISGQELPAVAADPDPCGRMLTIVQKRSQNFTLLNLKHALEEIERWDIVDDSETYLERDAEFYLERLAKSQTSAQETDFNAEAEALTLDDQLRIERGESKQHYDAFLLYADEDIDFVNDLIENLENKNDIKLCLKDRDLIPGITFEHEAVMRLISERCNRIIPVISPNFLNSPANKFFLNYAQANSIDKKQERKIIPCVYEVCEFPPQLTYYSKIYYNKAAPKFFWDKLARSLKVVLSQNTDTKKVFKPTTEEKSEIQQIPEYQIENQTQEESSSKLLNPIKMLRNHFPFSWKKQKLNENQENIQNRVETTQGLDLNRSSDLSSKVVNTQESTVFLPSPPSSEIEITQELILNLPSPPSSEIENTKESPISLPSLPLNELNSISSIAPIMGTSTNEIKNNNNNKKKKFFKNVKKLLAQ